jgi:hypothetical protein
VRERERERERGERYRDKEGERDKKDVCERVNIRERVSGEREWRIRENVRY